MAAVYTNRSANAIGVLDNRFQDPIVHYRGFKYASISKRFASPELVARDTTDIFNATKYGPRCPQVPLDVRELMQIPRHLAQNAPDKEDEFKCLNLNITAPKGVKAGDDLPVMFWIYGGSQIVSFSTAAHRLGDTGPLVAQSIAQKQPFILVTVNYRLNLFAYGNNKGPKNLQLQDLRLALRWVESYIHPFGGNPNNITLAGESAGGILCHALLLPTPPKSIKRIMCTSGTLYTSPPKPAHMAQPIIDRVLTRSRQLLTAKKHPNAQSLELSDIPVPVLIRAMAESSISTIWLQQSPELATWEDPMATFGRLDAIMLGDCEFEGVLWLQAARMFPEKAIMGCFTGTTKKEQKVPEENMRLVKAYLQNDVVADRRLGAVKSGALDFVMDSHFAYPNRLICEMVKKKKNGGGGGGGDGTGGKGRATKVFQFIFDEPNPWAKMSGKGVARAHHAIDLLALFGAFDGDLPDGSGFVEVGSRYRVNVIGFVNGMELWGEDVVVSYGPDGIKELGEREYGKVRRVEHFKVLEGVGRECYDQVWRRVADTADMIIAKAAAAMQAKQMAEAKKKAGSL